MRVAIKIAHAVLCTRNAEDDVVIAEEWNPCRNRIRPERSLIRAKGAVTDRAEVYIFGFGAAEVFRHLHTGGKKMVIENGLDGRKSLQPHHFFAIQFSIGFFELRMAFVWDGTESMVVRHLG